MKRAFSLVALATLTLAGAATTADAATATAALDVNSAYVWRGVTANDGLVLQPSIDVAAESGFSVNVWANYDADDYDGLVEENKFSEIDLTATYAFKLGPVDTSIGAIAYTFPTTHPDLDSDGNALNGDEKAINNTSEVFLGLGYDLGHGFALSGKIYYDFDQVDDFYITAGLGYSYSINDKTTLGLSGLISYAGEDMAEFYGGGTDSGFFNYQLTASIKYKVTDAFGIGANINFTDSMDDDVLTDEKVDTTVFGGVSLTYTF
jgi:outer membrane scaffolding protein for murein synthesis (MipA/OmpV family)